MWWELLGLRKGSYIIFMVQRFFQNQWLMMIHTHVVQKEFYGVFICELNLWVLKIFPKDKLNDHHENGIWTAQIPAWRQANCFPLRIAYSIKTLQGLLIFFQFVSQVIKQDITCTYIWTQLLYTCVEYVKFTIMSALFRIYRVRLRGKNGNSKLLHAVVSLLGDLCHYFIDPPDLSVPRQHFGEGGVWGLAFWSLGGDVVLISYMSIFWVPSQRRNVSCHFWGGICTTFQCCSHFVSRFGMDFLEDDESSWWKRTGGKG